MAPTTLPNQVTTTSPSGRSISTSGYPIKMAEMLSTMDQVAYIERVTVVDSPSIMKAKKAIKKAFQYQLEGKGFTMIEVLSTCPTNWGITPIEALSWVKENMVPIYPLGVYKDVDK